MTRRGGPDFRAEQMRQQQRKAATLAGHLRRKVDQVGGNGDQMQRAIRTAGMVSAQLLVDRGIRTKVSALPALRVHESESARDVGQAVTLLLLKGGLSPVGLDLVVAAAASGVLLAPAQRRELALLLPAIVGLSADDLEVLALLVDELAQRRSVGASQDDAQAGGLERLAALRLVDGDQATEVGRALARALVKVRAMAGGSARP